MTPDERLQKARAHYSQAPTPVSAQALDKLLWQNAVPKLLPDVLRPKPATLVLLVSHACVLEDLTGYVEQLMTQIGRACAVPRELLSS